jgi:N6-adenosine-specific RNA methylase IME4
MGAIQETNNAAGLPAIPQNFEFTSTGLSFDDSVSFEEWQKAGEFIKQVERASQWWIGDWLNASEKDWGERYLEALKETDSAYQTLANYKWVAAAIPLSVRTEKLSWNVHLQIAHMPAEHRAKAIKQAEKEGWTVREARRQVRMLKANSIDRKEQEFPSGKYRVIYADPPWSYGNEMAEYATTPLDHYPEMKTQAICDLSVKDLAMDNAVLFLWTTCPHLPEALQVCEAWGFEYKAQFVWDKEKHNMGHYNSVRHELLLICVRGSCTPDEQKLFDSVYVEPRTKHSKKPEYFREVIDTLYPSGPRIELFSRSEAEGWDVWGNESPEHIPEQSAA